MSSKPIVLGIVPIVGEQSWKKLGEWAELKVRQSPSILKSHTELTHNRRFMEIRKDHAKISSTNSIRDISVTYSPSTEEMKALRFETNEPNTVNVTFKQADQSDTGNGIIRSRAYQ